MTPEEITQARGQLVLRNDTGSPLSLTNYAGYTFAVGEELDIIDMSTPDTLMAGEYCVAKNMVGQASVGKAPAYTTYELAQRIQAGELSIIKDVPPDPRSLPHLR